MTLILTFVLVLMGLAALGIGWLVTGKSSLRAGSCGRAPDQKRRDECGKETSCSLCEKEKEEPKK